MWVLCYVNNIHAQNCYNVQKCDRLFLFNSGSEDLVRPQHILRFTILILDLYNCFLKNFALEICEFHQGYL